MALANYTDLKASIAGWLNRQDLTDVIPDFITLAEADINRTLRVRDQIVRATATLYQQYIALPSDFLKMDFLQLDVSYPHSMEFRTPDMMREDRSRLYSVAGEPKLYSVVGTTLEVAPTPDTEYTGQMGYYIKVPALSADEPTNWLLTKHPDVYLYGSLAHSAPYLKDDDRLAGWIGAYDRIMERIRVEDEAARISGSTPRVSFRRIG